MPLVLAMNESSESGIEYEDVPYVSYEYPRRYRNRVVSGTPFVYYRGRRKSGGGRQPQAYLGTGVIGDIWRSETAGRLVCEILDGAPFAGPLSFKNEDGSYMEPGGATRGYYVQGVRLISDGAFAAIIARAEAFAVGSTRPVRRPPGGGFRSPENFYAKSSVAREVEAQSRAIVTARLRRQHQNARVDEMPTNYPGYDLETNIVGLRFIEVKGTQAPFPRFGLSEGERRFGAANQDEYLLVVVFGMDLARAHYQGISCARAPLGSAHCLAPIQWKGRLSPKADDAGSYL